MRGRTNTKFYVDEFDRLAMTLEDYEMLSNEQKQKLDRNYWRFGGFLSGYFYFEEMTDEEKAVFAGQEMIV